jgi:hypothetical protein
MPIAFLAYKDNFLISYKSHAQYIRIESKGKGQESVKTLNLWQNNENE